MLLVFGLHPSVSCLPALPLPQSATRGGHASGGGGGHGGGGSRANTLDLSKHVDHPVIVKLSGGRQGRFCFAG